jgi:predicted DsbA family dithiol-disulfide isomerase
VTAEWARREFDADLLWLPYYLHPEYPPEGIPRSELHARYGFGDRDPMVERFAQAGLPYAVPDVVSNTRTALRLTELARELGVHEAFHDRLMQAYWEEAVDLGADDELRRLAAEVGVDPSALDDDTAFADAVRDDVRVGRELGVNGVPFFAIDRRFGVSGAQSPDVILDALEQAWAEAHAA